MNMVNIKINGMPLSVPAGSTILEAARANNIEIPTLCYLKEINEIGACRMCVVEVKGAKSLVAACVFPVNEGMEVVTNSKTIFNSRKQNLELLLSNHNKKCLSCVRSGKCELQTLCHQYGVDEDKFDGAKNEYEIDTTAAHMIRDNSKCILCRRCSAVCKNVQKVGVIGPNERGFNTHIGCAFEADLGDIACVSCGQCIAVCPTGALHEKDQTDLVWEALGDPSKHVIVQTAPAVRVTLGECFDMPIGTNVTGKMAAALRRIGFNGVFDTDTAADFTIVEEANELVDRIKNGGTLPMITSCSPGWIKFCEHYYPDMLPHLSSCKSPQQMFGALSKTWYAKKIGVDPKDMVVVSVMPCTAKKFEVARDDQNAAGVPDVDIALTTRELARMITRAGLDFKALPDEEFDAPLGVSTGAAVIFGASGGVMEAALRTANAWLTGETPKVAPEFKEVRGMAGIKEATYKVGGLELKAAIASGLTNVAELLDAIKKGEKEYHFIEIMCCPGGCINGGGQPQQFGNVRNFVDLKGLRAGALYDADTKMPMRQSHENPVIKEVYDDYLGSFGSHEAHKVLHTSYVKRSQF